MKEPVVMPQAEETTEKYPNRYKPGQSGNPGGRPRKTPAELKAVEMMKQMTPEAVEVVAQILRNKNASLYARLQAAEIIFNRAMGRPETYLKVDQGEQSVEAAAAKLQSLFASGDDEEGENALAEAAPDESTEDSVSADVPASAEDSESEVSHHAV